MTQKTTVAHLNGAEASLALVLSGGCEVTFYVNKLLSKLIHAGRDSLDETAYTDNESLQDAVYSTKQTLEKQLIVDISSLCELGDRNEVKLCGQKRISRGTTEAFMEIPKSSQMLNV